jgi:hypothetical protein
MSRYNVLRFGKFATFLVLMLLWASAAPIDARIERDNGVVRVNEFGARNASESVRLT